MLLFLRVLWRVLFVVAFACGAAACGSEDANPGPTGKPAAVVRAAPDVTLRTGTARVVGAAPGVSATGTVHFSTGEDDLRLAGRRRDETPPFGVTEPVAVIDLLRGVVEVKAYGGVQVQGVGAKRYELEIDVAKAIAAAPAERRDTLRPLEGVVGPDNLLWADVFVDSDGRVRRVLLPVDTAAERPHGDDKHIPKLVSVDFSDFGGDQ